MSEQGPMDRAPGDKLRACPVCGMSTTAAGRYCAECGALLPAPLANPSAPEIDGPWTRPGKAPAQPASPTAAATPDPSGTPESRDGGLWILGARPAAVIGGGLLLLLLAAALLFAGQLDDTGTVVMLSICVAPLALLTIAIGITRAIGSAADRG